MILVDMDGCISDDRPRRVFIKDEMTQEDWDLYHACMGEDKACHIDRLHLRGRNDVIILTGRPERYREDTERWLKEKGIKPDDIIMRPDDDRTPAAVFKKKAAAILLSLGIHIDSAYDDRPDIIEAYRALGIRASLLTVEMADGT